LTSIEIYDIIFIYNERKCDMEDLRELVEKLAEENIQLRYDLAFVDGKIDNLVGRIMELEARLDDRD
jgi:predicted nuclease with TOPRIM domain